MKTKIKKSIALIMLVLTILSSFSNIVFAQTEISSARLQNGGDCGYHLQFWDSNRGIWSYIITTFVYYNENGREYPAYCLNRELPGVGGQAGGDSYTVNIDHVMEDVRIWRTVINGYPYQTPEAMGVENKFDAFVATKQAIYSILYGTDVNSYYNGGDSRGVAIKNAVMRLVDIGRYGTQTPNNTDIQVNKTEGFYEDGNYYSQNYKINAPVETSEYTITATAGLPSGSKITDLNNNEKPTFSGSETFKVKIPKDKLTSDVNAVINVRAKCKTYPVFYGETTIPGTQNYLVTFDPFGDSVGRANFNVATNTGKIQINKTDDETLKPINGVTFGLYKKDGTEVARSTTNESGVATFQGLYQNNYTLKELSTNSNYILNKLEFNVNVEYNKTTQVNVENEHKKGNLKVYKVDKDNNQIRLGNVSFELYSEEFNKVLGTYATNVDGEISIQNLRIGNYKLIEKNTGKWYDLAEDTQVKVEWNETTPVTVENELQKGRVKILKVDSENNEIKLKGVVFEIQDKNGKVLETITTDANGEAMSSRYAIRDYGKLYIHEIKTNEFYKLNDEIVEVTLQANQITSQKIMNEKKKGQVEIIKVDKDNNEVKIPGVTFEIYDENNNKVDTLITDENGKAVSKLLPIDQEYTIKETITGEFYVLNEETQKVTLKEDEITSITFENEKKKGQVEIIKIDKDNNEVRIPNVTFEIYDENNTKVDTLTTNENGKAVSKLLPIDQEYTIKETITGEFYVLNEETQKVTLKENEITSITFENEKKKGQVEIIKIDKDNNEVRIPDVTFEVYDENNDKVDTLITDENGKAVSKLLPIDQEYTIKETITGEFYVLNEDTQKVTLKENEITSITFENKKKKGQIKVIKIDGETQVLLEGVTFEILDSKGNIVDEIVTDKNGEATSIRLAIDDVYTAYEKSTKKGYILTMEKQTVELTENEITTLKFENYKEKGSIKIIKETSDGNNKEKIEFKITGTSTTGEYIEAIYKTNESGEIIIDKILSGEYTIEELQNEINSNYIIPDAQTIKVENDTNTEITFYNQLIETPKTGDNRNTFVYVILFLISSAGLVAISIKRHISKKNKK